MLQDLFHVGFFTSSSCAVFEAAGCIQRLEATVVCAGGSSEIVYLVHLFADEFALLQACFLVDLNRDV